MGHNMSNSIFACYFISMLVSAALINTPGLNKMQLCPVNSLKYFCVRINKTLFDSRKIVI